MGIQELGVTGGEWVVDTIEDGTICLYADSGFQPHVAYGTTGVDTKTQERNFALIAASKELYKALEAVRDVYPELCAALAKARGEA